MQRFRAAALAALFLTLLVPVAFAGAKGSNMFALQFTNGTADLYDPRRPNDNYVSAYDHSEIGAQVETWHFMTDEYATTVAFGVGMFGETDKPGNSPPAGATDFKYTQSSWNLRIGGDRVIRLGDDRNLIWFGPGIEYWSGTAKFEGGLPGAVTYETENVTRWSFSGRIGTTMMLNRSVGLGGHVGHRMGMANAKDNGREANWWPSSFEAAGGIFFSFGS